jgi:type IV pilus assembly protein PilY1
MPSEDYLLAHGESAPVDGIWRARNSSYNRIYYNPLITYSPWPGEDNTGTAYGNSSPTAARYNPYDASVGTRDLTATMSFSTRWDGSNITVTNFYPARYYTWTDTDGDGVIDANDGHALVEIKSTTPTYTGGADRTDCASAPTCTYAEEIQNFANWYTYYRKREYTAKNAVSSVISTASFARMGYATINNNNNVKIKVATMTDAGNKDSLLDKVFQTDSGGFTYLRTKLRDTGRYFKCANNNIFDSSATNCPIVDEASGGACQQNYTILMTDGYYNGSDPDLSGEGAGYSDDADSDEDTDFDGGTYADSIDDTLADVAMHFYEHDLDGTLDNDVPVTLGVDEADHQHMVTYTVAFGVNGTLDPNSDDPTDAGFSWPDPDDGDAEKIDDLWHAAYNGRGQFLSAQNPEELTSALSSAVNSITDRTSTAAAVAFNSTTLGTDSFVYLARFNTAKWSGDLLSFALDPITGDVASNYTWSAATVLDARNLSSSACSSAAALAARNSNETAIASFVIRFIIFDS